MSRHARCARSRTSCPGLASAAPSTPRFASCTPSATAAFTASRSAATTRTRCGEFFRAADMPTVTYRAHRAQSSGAPMPFVRDAAHRARPSRMDVDLLHCADVDAGIEAAIAGRIAGVPVLCHVRNPVLAVSRRERVMLSPVRRFVFVSQDTWSTFGLHVGPSRGRVLYDGIVPEVGADADARAEVRARALARARDARRRHDGTGVAAEGLLHARSRRRARRW